MTPRSWTVRPWRMVGLEDNCLSCWVSLTFQGPTVKLRWVLVSNSFLKIVFCAAPNWLLILVIFSGGIRPKNTSCLKMYPKKLLEKQHFQRHIIFSNDLEDGETSTTTHVFRILDLTQQQNIGFPPWNHQFFGCVFALQSRSLRHNHICLGSTQLKWQIEVYWDSI